MLYLISQIVVCLILATLLGLLIGWWLRSLRARHDLNELEAQWQARQSEQTQQLQQQLDTLASKRLESEKNANKFLARTRTLEQALSDKEYALENALSELATRSEPVAPTAEPSDLVREQQLRASLAKEHEQALRELRGQLATQEATISALQARVQNNPPKNADQLEIDAFQHGPSIDPDTLIAQQDEAAAAQAYLEQADFSANPHPEQRPFKSAAKPTRAKQRDSNNPQPSDNPAATESKNPPPTRAPRVIGRTQLAVDLPEQQADSDTAETKQADTLSANPSHKIKRADESSNAEPATPSNDPRLLAQAGQASREALSRSAQSIKHSAALDGSSATDAQTEHNELPPLNASEASPLDQREQPERSSVWRKLFQ